MKEILDRLQNIHVMCLKAQSTNHTNKDEILKVANSAINFTHEAFLPGTINGLVMDEYRKKNKDKMKLD